MAKKQYSLVHSFMQRIASSRPGASFFARTQHHFDRILLKLSNGRLTLTSLLAGLPIVVVTCTGAKSGLPRTIPLLRIQDEANPNTFAVIASNWGQSHHPGWYHNLKANPRATCLIDGQTHEYMTHEASSDEYDRFWQLALETYVGFPGYKERAGDRTIPIMVMERAEG
jgi:deazaflavin-dependent oxidoreductase (nitroreductase family)